MSVKEYRQEDFCFECAVRLTQEEKDLNETLCQTCYEEAMNDVE